MQSSFEVYSLLNILQTMKIKLRGQTWKISFQTIWTDDTRQKNPSTSKQDNEGQTGQVMFQGGS